MKASLRLAATIGLSTLLVVVSHWARADVFENKRMVVAYTSDWKIGSRIVKLKLWEMVYVKDGKAYYFTGEETGLEFAYPSGSASRKTDSYQMSGTLKASGSTLQISFTDKSSNGAGRGNLSVTISGDKCTARKSEFEGLRNENVKVTSCVLATGKWPKGKPVCYPVCN